MGQIHFTEDAFKQAELYTELCSVEVAALGYATLVDDVVEVSEIFLVPQQVSGSSVEFMDNGFPWAVQKALKEDRLDELRFCWHSHVNFAAQFSSTDKDMIRRVHKSGPIPWFASAILNKKGETWGQLDYFATDGELGNFAKHVTIPLDVTYGEFDLERTEIVEEELEMFLTKKPTPPKTGGNYTSKGKVETKTPATKANEKLDPITKEPIGASGCTPADWKLHNKAKIQKWDSYLDPEHYVHYWDPNDTEQTYKGCAPMPKKPDGGFILNIEFTVKDADVIETLDGRVGEYEDDEIDELVERVMERDGGAH